MTIDGIATPARSSPCTSTTRRARAAGHAHRAPSYFLKPSSSLAASGGIARAPGRHRAARLRGRDRARHRRARPPRRPDDAWTHVAAVTAANDFGLYDLRAADKGSNVRSKGGDGFTPIGPALIAAAASTPTPARAHLGQRRARAGRHHRHAALPVRPARRRPLAAHHPRDGDVILTGTPAGSSVVVPGDVVEVEVDAPMPRRADHGPARHDVTAGPRRRSATSAPSRRSTTCSASRRGASRERRRARRGGRRAAAEPAATALTVLTPRRSKAPRRRDRLGRVGVATLSVALRKRG